MPTTSVESFKYICDLVKRRAAIVVEPGKEYLVDSRLLPVARVEGLDSVDALVSKLRGDERGHLCSQVIEAMTTNETSFFRDIHPFEALKQTILPAIIKARATTRTLRLWCAAASTGQEPYSIAMTIREHFPELASWTVQIIATDLNVAVLDRARSGLYRQLEVNRGLPAQMLVKYFDRRGMEWEIKPDLRKMISFQELNLLDRWPLFSAPDIVFMRNVLIYFDVPTKKEILKRVRLSMRADGFLVLGGAETTINIDDQFEGVRAGNTIAYQPKTQEQPKVVNASR
jgi:chemotaxis protein methyltransferase CheR